MQNLPSLPPKIKIRHYSHDHDLQWKKDLIQFTCNGCKEIGWGGRYDCEKKDCDYCLHYICATWLKSDSRKFVKDKGSFKIFRETLKKHHICQACGGDVKGYVFLCGKDYALHPACTDLPRDLKLDGTDLHLDIKFNSKCDHCKHLKPNGGKSKVKGWGYQSSSKRHHYHVACVKDLLIGKGSVAPRLKRTLSGTKRWERRSEVAAGNISGSKRREVSGESSRMTAASPKPKRARN